MSALAGFDEGRKPPVLRDIKRFLRETFILNPAERAMRLRSRLDPRVYDAKRRVKAVTPGALPAGGAHWMVFVFNSVSDVPPFLACVFDACRRLDVNLAVATNVALSPAVRGYVLENSSLLVERESVGRDIGAYKDALDILSDRFGPESHLILANDSVFYDRDQIDDLISRSLAHPGFGAVTEVFEAKHHAQSYFLSFAPAVRTSGAFRQFWREYLPLSTRKWAIGKGEVGLSRALRAGGIAVRPLWTPQRLRERLANSNEDQLLDLMNVLPTANRAHIAKTVGKVSRAIPGLPRTRVLTDAIVDEVGRTNQTSIGGFAYRMADRFPVLKRDIYFRGLYPFHEIERLIVELGVPDAQAILDDLRTRGRITDLKVSRVTRYFYRRGLF
jgi:hypothetical protein